MADIIGWLLFWTRSRPSMLLALAFAVSLATMACTPPPAIERPREGAQAGASPGRLESGPPPTLVAASSLSATSTPGLTLMLPSPSPSPEAAASPVPSPGTPPIITGLQPGPGTTLPPGDIAVGARVTATNDLVDVIFYIDDEPIPIDLSGPPTRMKTVSMVRTFTLGKHLLRIQARDSSGQLGGYRWEFTVGTARQALPTTPPRPTAPDEPTATPFPVPTRRPTVTAAPKPGATAPAAPKPAESAPQPGVPAPKPGEAAPKPGAPAPPVILPAVNPAATPAR